MKIINNPDDFELQFNNTFGNIGRRTLVNINEDTALHVELGGQGENVEQRLEQAFIRGNKVLKYCFGAKSVWLRIILWTGKEDANLADAGFKIFKATKVFRQQVLYEPLNQFDAGGEVDTLYAYFKRYSKIDFSPTVRSIINYDMAIDPSANITCYYINFNTMLIVNIYDDRGLVIHSPDKALLKDIETEFCNWLM